MHFLEILAENQYITPAQKSELESSYPDYSTNDLIDYLLLNNIVVIL